MNCTAPWSDPFTVLLAVEGDCSYLENFDVPVTVNAKPTVTATLEDQDNFICSTDGTAVYTFRVNTDVGETLTDPIRVTIEDDAENACLFTDNSETSTTGTLVLCHSMCTALGTPCMQHTAATCLLFGAVGRRGCSRHVHNKSCDVARSACQHTHTN